MQQARKSAYRTSVGPFHGEFVHIRPSTSDPAWTKVLLMELDHEMSSKQKMSLEKEFGRTGSILSSNRVPKGGTGRKSFMVYLWIPTKYDVFSLPVKRVEKKPSQPTYLLLSLRGEDLYVFIEKDGVNSRLITRRDSEYESMKVLIAHNKI